MGTRNFPNTGTDIVYCLNANNDVALDQLKELIDNSRFDLGYATISNNSDSLYVYKNNDTALVNIDNQDIEIYISLKIKIVHGYYTDKCFTIENEMYYDCYEYNDIKELEDELKSVTKHKFDIKKVENILSSLKKEVISLLDQISDYKLKHVCENIYEQVK